MNERAALLIIAILLLLGTSFFHSVENWSFIDSFYFSTITLTTVGYGDLAPTKDISKIFVSLYSILGIGVMLYTLGSIIGKSAVEKGEYLHGLLSDIYDLRHIGRLRKKRKLNREITKSLIKRR